MKTTINTRLFYGLAILILFLSSCKKPKDDDKDNPVAEVSNKVFIMNEGSFLNSNASVSMLDLTENKMYDDLFFKANERTIGDVLQSMTVVNGKYYFVVNNSDKIEVTDDYPLSSKGVITGFNQPRYMVAVGSNKAYVSEHIAYGNPTGRVSVVDLNTNAITSTITVGAQPENMISYNNKLFVCISGEDKLDIINTSSDAIEGSLTLAEGPNSIVKDADGKLWVLCGGKIEYDVNWDVDQVNSIPGVLYKINPATNTIESAFTFSSNTGSPSQLVIDGSRTTLYFKYDNAVYSHSTSATALSSTPIINRSFYGLGVDPVANTIYTGTYGFSSNQKLIRYTTTGSAIDSFTVGIGPNSFVFQYK